MRFFIAMFSHETSTFSTISTDHRQFEAGAPADLSARSAVTRSAVNKER